ncbi:MAG: hypothetical protein KDD44_08865 [Bdellovibrionales bacterium]|nr:hypothetical protein [Bdellovibrionales bacterium]
MRKKDVAEGACSGNDCQPCEECRVGCPPCLLVLGVVLLLTILRAYW